MSTPENSPPTEPEDAPHAATVIRPARSRRKPILAAAGIAIVVVGGLATYWLVNSQSQTVSVLRSSAHIERGEQITADDITTLNVDPGQQIDAFAAADATALVGQVALVDLPEGSILTPRSVGEQLSVPEGYSLVGLALTSAQLPSQAVTAGTLVRVVETPTQQGDPPAETPEAFTGEIFSVSWSEEQGVYLVNVLVAEADAADVAARAATSRVALVVDPGQE